MSNLVFESQITFFRTNDLLNTAQFYEEIIGLKLVLDQGKCRIYQVSKGGYIGFCHSTIVSADKSTVIFTLVTSEVDKWYEKLESKGVVFESKLVYNSTYKIYHAILKDPNGYLIEIQKFIDPRWK